MTLSRFGVLGGVLREAIHADEAMVGTLLLRVDFSTLYGGDVIGLGEIPLGRVRLGGFDDQIGRAHV